jgi:hypothetical protein
MRNVQDDAPITFDDHALELNTLLELFGMINQSDAPQFGELQM